MRGLSVFVVLAIMLTSFSGLAFATVPDRGTAATATSRTISDFDFSGINAKNFSISDGAHAAEIALTGDLTDMDGLVGFINQALTDAHAALTASNSGSTFKLTSSIIGKNSYLAVSGNDAAAFFAVVESRGMATDAESVADTKASLTPFFGEDESMGRVLTSMTLPTEDMFTGTGITWSSGTPDIIEINGNQGFVKSQPLHDTIVILTASITKGSVTETQDYELNVIGSAPPAMTDTDAVANTSASLSPFYAADESSGYVTQSLRLPTADAINGTDISWSSENPTIIQTDCAPVFAAVCTAMPNMIEVAVRRPAVTAEVTLTAHINRNGESADVTFPITVIGTDSEVVLFAKAGLNPGYANGDSPSSVTQPLVLPSTLNGNTVTVSWSSANAAVLGADGTVHRPSFTAGSAEVELTATLKLHDAVETKTFSITVSAMPETDEEAVTYDHDHLSVGYQTGDSASKVTGNLTLAALGAHGSAIAWSSDKPAVISNDGKEHRITGRDETVTLTAEITKGDETSSASFIVKVRGMAYETVADPGETVTPPAPAVDLTSATKALIGAFDSKVIVAPVRASTTDTGDTVTTINEADLLKQAGDTGVQAVVVPVAESNGKSIVSLTAGLLTELLKQDAKAKVVFQVHGVTYELPAALANTAALEQALGLSGEAVKDAELRITIELVPASAVQQQITAANGTPATAVASFSIDVVTADRTYALNDFQGIYVNRSFELQPAADKTTAVGVVLHSDGSVTPVPTDFTVVGDTTVAVLKTDHNSVYTVISHASKLSDIDGSWAKDKIGALANKLIINGYENGMFKPNANVTRAEFAQMIAKGLGLNAGTGTPEFTDVHASAWYAGVLDAMVSRGFITGYADGSFKANQSITRQEEAVILGRVLAYLHQAPESNASSLEQFHDRDAIAGYAKSAVAALAGMKIMNGDAKGNLNPTAAATRAETAALIYNLLHLTGLINE
ncbi:S-layer homology domain-containing protein [Paenibacillus rhizovicinus]|uniref:S-layer homology domain-containing protein n=1 Tax=Paenibacillus rhizovicinus TaxID=2704463 RepID=A0A6C0P104_9BACL|nr:S-layer homology domain-containing protein [Paenibacillus rhizovicinus]QHW32061.1 S-layer homology domain-containing protein [Paenibacillus rhizovicinus]